MPHRYSICSYSFRRSFESGAMDYPGYVPFTNATDCRSLIRG